MGVLCCGTYLEHSEKVDSILRGLRECCRISWENCERAVE